MKAFHWAAIAVAALGFATAADAHDRSSRSTASPTLGKEQAAAAPEDDKVFLTSDKLFLWRLHWINHSEIQGGELARAKAGTEGVRRYGEMLMTDHRRAEEKLMELAEAKNIDLELTRDEYRKVRDRLSKQMTGMMDMAHEDVGEFERQFVTHMRTDHANAIRLVKEYRRKTKDKEIRSHIDELLPVLQRHEEEAKTLLDQVGERRDVRGVDEDPAELPEKKKTSGNGHPEEGASQQEEDIEEDIERRVEPDSALDPQRRPEPESPR